jgi:hypothetical protein
MSPPKASQSKHPYFDCADGPFMVVLCWDLGIGQSCIPQQVTGHRCLHTTAELQGRCGASKTWPPPFVQIFQTFVLTLNVRLADGAFVRPQGAIRQQSVCSRPFSFLQSRVS